MSRIAVIVLLALLLPASADAALVLGGNAKPRHSNWAAMAAANVPLADTRITVWSDHDPAYDPGLRELYLPQPGRGGWTYWDERVLFVHELGHVFDFQHLSRSERDRFRAAVGTSCSWWSKRCFLPNSRENVPPGEMFAEQYGACALGMTKQQLDAVPAVSYGWLPPVGGHATLCSLIQSFA